MTHAYALHEVRAIADCQCKKGAVHILACCAEQELVSNLVTKIGSEAESILQSLASWGAGQLKERFEELLDEGLLQL